LIKQDVVATDNNNTVKKVEKPEDVHLEIKENGLNLGKTTEHIKLDSNKEPCNQHNHDHDHSQNITPNQID
jgi:hypothetical protein